MVDGVNQQPGLFQRIGNFFGADDPNAGQPIDPFAGLSRAQRTMLGFAALRDAAASLEGRDSNFFQSALGGFEQARERERLRTQGAEANRNQALQNLVQLEALAQMTNDPGILALVQQQRDTLMGNIPGMTAAATGARVPTPAASTSTSMPTTVAPSAPPITGPNIMDAQGNVVGYVDDQGREVMVPAGAVTSAPIVSDETSADTPASLDAEEAAILAEINRLENLALVAGRPAPTRGLELDLASIEGRRERLAEDAEAAAAAETTRIASEDDARQAGFYVSLIESVMNDPALENVVGRIEGRADPRGATGAALFGDAEMDILGKLEQLGGAAFLQAFESLKGGGQITQIEGDKATRAITRLDQRAVSPEAYRSALEELRQVYANAQARARGQELPFPEINVEGAAPSAGAPQVPRISTDADYDALPSGAQFIDPEGVVRRKP